jgi:FkbM family methyltransferase
MHELWRALGVTGAIRYSLGGVWCELLRRADYFLTSPHAVHPICIRRNSADRDVFAQIFVEAEYRGFGDLPVVRSIMDCGANIGCASAWFLTRYPLARLVAIEPDSLNVVQLRRNLAKYGDRAVVIHGALWDQNVGLVVDRGAPRWGWEYAVKVRAARREETPDVSGMDLSTVFARFGQASIDVLKVDIEGAESVVFASCERRLLHRVGQVLIEVHGSVAGSIVFAAFPESSFRCCRSGEINEFRRIADSLP